MSPSLELPICSCCHRNIMPNDKSVKFNCPNCEKGDLIWRCESCRVAVRNYKCSVCNFEGP
jgi:predicted RNA-binding Zn-ribbon protein involved in translation (DUF1610 family)